MLYVVAESKQQVIGIRAGERGELGSTVGSLSCKTIGGSSSVKTGVGLAFVDKHASRTPIRMSTGNRLTFFMLFVVLTI